MKPKPSKWRQIVSSRAAEGIVLLVALGVMLVMVFFPPTTGERAIRGMGVPIDWGRLLLRLLGVALVAGMAIVSMRLFGGKIQSNDDAPKND